MGKFIRTSLVLMIAVTGLATTAACSTDSETISYNISEDADNFKVNRRVVFFNGITDTYLLTIEGYCSIQDADGQLEVTCKVGEDTYKKHFLGLSDNVTYFIEQLEPVESDPYHYKVIFKPEVIVPDIDLRTSGDG